MPNLDLVQILVALLVLLMSLTVHEAAHAWSADRLGDATARLLGRISLNPAVHVDFIGTIVFPLVALTTGLPVLGWAKPVPVNVAQLGRGWKEKYMAIAAAGPASNLVLAMTAAIVLRILPADAGAATRVLQMAIFMNVLLAVFNMIPVPPLDGGNVLSGLLRGNASDAYDRIRPYGFLILYGLMFSGLLSTLVVPPAQLLISWLL